MNRHDRRAAAREEARLDAIAARAGLDESEIRRDPEHGVLVSASGVRKLCALSTDASAVRFVLDLVAREQRNEMRLVHPASNSEDDPPASAA